MSTQPKYRKMYQKLRRAIASGAFAPGVQLPTEPSFADHGATRQTVFNPLDTMKHEGIIISRREDEALRRARQTDADELFFLCIILQNSIASPTIRKNDANKQAKGFEYERNTPFL